jgi:hypothetical protein
MKTPRSKLWGIKRKMPLNLLEASFGESYPKRLIKLATSSVGTTAYRKLRSNLFYPDRCSTLAI